MLLIKKNLAFLNYFFFYSHRGESIPVDTGPEAVDTLIPHRDAVIHIKNQGLKLRISVQYAKFMFLVFFFT